MIIPFLLYDIMARIANKEYSIEKWTMKNISNETFLTYREFANLQKMRVISIPKSKKGRIELTPRQVYDSFEKITEFTIRKRNLA